ncbi:MAG: ECF transporter S component [Ruminococcaceae bacterium]|nr:ECF transporter S component [Oscillospiraceae bacterium]
MSKTTYRSTKVRTLVAVGVFSALAYVCCVLFHFKAGFLSFDLKDAVMTVAAMLFGPMYGFAMSLIVSAIESLTIGTTELYGFVMDVLSSVSFICVGSFIYSRMRNMMGAVLGMVSSIIVMTAVMMGANMIITPIYMKTTAAEVAALIPTVLLPFNLTKAVFNASLVFLLYKPFSKALRYSGFTASVSGRNASSSSIPDITGGSKNSALSSVIITAVSILIGVLALVYFFTVLKGSFSIV